MKGKNQKKEKRKNMENFKTHSYKNKLFGKKRKKNAFRFLFVGTDFHCYTNL